jgi:hypothetical protein
MKLGYVTVAGKGGVDLFLAEVVERLEAEGVALAGTVQTNVHRHDRTLCDMDLRLLPDGPVVRISVDRGPEARGCRLDAGALEESVPWVLRSRRPRAGGSPERSPRRWSAACRCWWA